MVSRFKAQVFYAVYWLEQDWYAQIFRIET